MKKVTLLFILMLPMLLCKGQGLLEEGKLWSTSSITMPGSSYSSYFIKIMGDTTINGLGYKKILRSDDALHAKWTLNGCIREESTTGKVFIFNSYVGKELLLYDFSLEIGDSILAGDSISYAKVTKIVNASFGSSTEIRKQIYFFDSSFGSRWIEGIGSTQGVLEGLNSFFMTGATHSLVCYSEKDQLIYHNPRFSTCFPQGQELNVDAGSDVMVCSPNHSGDRTQLTGVASGGVEPYTYTWSGRVPIYYDYIKWIKASEFLNDTTISNPSFKSMDAPEDWVTFYLKVEDAAGNVEYDSVKIIAATIWILNSYILPKIIKRGDSIKFYGDIYFYENKFLPMQYTFSPTHGLSDPHDIFGWAKPDTSTTYYLQVVNSAGCVAKISYWRINVDTTTVSNNEVANPSTQCFLNQGDLILHLPGESNSPYHLTITTANGTIVHEGKYRNRDLLLSDLNLVENQLYVVSIIDGDKRMVFKLIGN